MSVTDVWDLNMKVTLSNSGNPVITAGRISPVIADPTFVTPEDSPDRKWHLYAHNLWGVQHYTSVDGLSWKNHERVVTWGMRPFLYRHEDRFYLYYEKYRPFGLVTVWSSSRKWKSSIYMIESADLVSWSKPVEVLTARLDWHADGRYGRAVGNPCVARFGDHFKLYYSAGFSYIPDCGFFEPRYIGYAEAAHPRGPFTPREEPLFEPDASDEWRNLASGSIKVIKYQDHYLGFQNGIYWNEKQRQSGSAILTLRSSDGVSWQPNLGNKPIISPIKDTWMQSHVYACDVKQSAANQLTIYFNARDKWHWTEGKESIGCGVIDLDVR